MANTANQTFFLESLYMNITVYILHSPDSRRPSLVRKNLLSTVLKAKLLSSFSCLNVQLVTH